MAWPIETHSVNDLYLDMENIRIPIIHPAQDAVIIDLFENENAFDIAKSYSQNRLFPDEVPIGVKDESGKIIVIEGNRRVAALKALLTPEIVPTFERRLKALINPGIEVINICIAPSKSAALQQIANRHTIAYRRPWEPLRQAFFYQSQLNNGKTIEELIVEYPEQDVVSFIRRLEIYHLAKTIDYGDEEINQKVANERKFPISTVERFFDDVEIREQFGVTIDKTGRFHGHIQKEEFDKPFKKLISEIATNKINSRNSNNHEERKKIFLDKLEPAEKPNLKKTGGFTSQDFDVVVVKKEKKVATGRSVKTPKGLFLPSMVPYKIDSSALRYIYNELKDIDVANFPNAAHDLLRSFLECSLVLFFQRTGEWGKIEKSNQHNPTLNEMLKFAMSQDCLSLSEFRDILTSVKSDYALSFSLQRLNMINHNPHWVSTENDVRVAWARLEPIFKKLLIP